MSDSNDSAVALAFSKVPKRAADIIEEDKVGRVPNGRGVVAVTNQDIARLEKQPPQQKPDPEMAKIQGELQIRQQESQARLQESAQKHQQDMQATAQDHQTKIQQIQEKHAQEMRQNQQEFQLKIAEMQQAFKLDMTQMLTDMVTSIRKEAEAARFGTLEKASATALSLESDKSKNGGDNGDKKK